MYIYLANKADSDAYSDYFLSEVMFIYTRRVNRAIVKNASYTCPRLGLAEIIFNEINS